MTYNLVGLPWANITEGYGYITTGTASPPYNHLYKIPGTVQNYYCREYIPDLSYSCLYLICTGR
jgi:hypothetical protein